jgi:hypothetical protein
MRRVSTHGRKIGHMTQVGGHPLARVMQFCSKACENLVAVHHFLTAQLFRAGKSLPNRYQLKRQKGDFRKIRTIIPIMVEDCVLCKIADQWSLLMIE